MNTKILHKEVLDFINSNLKSDINKLIFKGSPFAGITIQELSNQIVAKSKSEKKLPTWFTTQNIFYPKKISIEQTSSEKTAAYKSNLISGKSIIDITGGFGVDCFYFSKVFENVTHCEINEELSQIVTHNYKELDVTNIKTIHSDGLEYLKNTSDKFDCIYVDPSRRNDVKGKVFLLRDCLPNVPKNLDFLFEKSDTILIKNSPMLDISNGINELRNVKDIHVVAVKNEVKELLFLLEKDYQDSIEVKTVNLINDKIQKFNFKQDDISNSTYSAPLDYLYEPNAAILKSGGFHELSKQLNIAKLHEHSHLYTSELLMENFPGRKFKIIEILDYQKKTLKQFLKGKKINITTRNFPKSVDQVRKETSSKDGGKLTLFCTTNLKNNKIAIVAQQLF